MVTCKFSFFFNLVDKNSFTVKKIFCVAKMASTVYETEICSAGYQSKKTTGEKLLFKFYSFSLLLLMLLATIGGFHMTSLKYKLQNYWSSWDFTFRMSTQVRQGPSSYSPEKSGNGLYFKASVVATWNFARSERCQFLYVKNMQIRSCDLLKPRNLFC